jgi:lanosterol synthase
MQSCVSGEYSQHEQSQVVQTAWTVLSLIYAQHPDKQVVRRAVDLIMSRQLPVSSALCLRQLECSISYCFARSIKDGQWLQEDTEGIFNKNCAIDYPSMSFADTVKRLDSH